MKHPVKERSRIRNAYFEGEQQHPILKGNGGLLYKEFPPEILEII